MQVFVACIIFASVLSSNLKRQDRTATMQQKRSAVESADLNIVATATAVLRAVPDVDDSLRADLWDVFVISPDSKKLASQLAALGLPDVLQEALVSAKSGRIPSQVTAADISREKMALLAAAQKEQETK
jgi:hypothetical protein